MSMAEDYDFGFSHDDFCVNKPRFEDLVWTTKDNTEILICCLEDDHLLNIVRLLRKKDLTVPYQMELELSHRKLRGLI